MPAALFSRIQLVQDDITHQQVSAIVNAANSSLLGGQGLDGAIHHAGGPLILKECRYLREHHYPNGLQTGQATITTGGKMPAKYVIHTVGPIWHGGKQREPELLADCYRNCLKIAFDRQLASVAFPGISTGVYGYPKKEASAIAVREVQQWLVAHDFPQKVIFVVFDDENRPLYEQELSMNIWR